MKKMYLILSLLLCLVKPQLKAQTPAPLNGFYQNYYRIYDAEKGYSLDRSSSSNVYGWSGGYHGGDNQQWVIMPTYVGSNEYFIANKQNGSILDIHSGGNVYAADSYTHGGNNQVFKLTPVPNSPGYYYIGSPANSQKVFDRSNSSQTKDPFNNPGQYRNNIYFGNFHGGNNQRFYLQTLGRFTYPMTSYRTKNNTAIAQPPKPTNLQGSGLCMECNETYRAEAILPFTMVQDDVSRTQQSLYYPFYRLEYSRVWKLVGSVTFPAGTSETKQLTEVVGMKDTYVTEVTRALKVSFSSNGEINFKLGEVGAKVANTLGASYEKTTKTVSTHEVNYSQTRQVNISFTATKHTLIAEYQLVERYRLYRPDGTKIREWDVNLAPEFNTRVAYIDGEPGGRLAQGPAVIVQNQGYSSENVYQIQLANSYEQELGHNADFNVKAVYPNPFQSSVKIDLSAAKGDNVQVELYNLLGQKVKHADKVIAVGGDTTLEVDGLNLPEGLYVIKVEATAIDDPKKKGTYQQKVILRR